MKAKILGASWGLAFIVTASLCVLLPLATVQILYADAHRTEQAKGSHVEQASTSTKCIYKFTIGEEEGRVSTPCRYSGASLKPEETMAINYDPKDLNNAKEASYSVAGLLWLLAVPLELILLFGAVTAFKATREVRKLKLDL